MNLIDRPLPGYPCFYPKIICTIGDENDLLGPWVDFPKIYDAS